MMKRRVMMMLSTIALGSTVAGCMNMTDGSMDDGMSGQTAMADSMDTVMVGGAEMYPNRTIVQNAVNSPIHTTLVAAVKQAGLVDTLNSAGPFTVFAPTDAAFAKVPMATRESLMMPANKAELTKVLTYHVVPGRITAADLMARIKAGGGSAMLATVQGEKLTFMMHDGGIMVKGMAGSGAMVTQGDVMQSNGVIHVVDGVLLP